MYLATNVAECKQGFEFTLQHKFFEKYYTELGYSYLKAQGMSGTDKDLIRLNSQPNGYWLALGYKDAKWNLGIEGSSATGRDSRLFGDSAYSLWIFRADYRINNNTTAYLKVNNLSNEAYRVKATTILADSPMPARNYQLGLQYTF